MTSASDSAETQTQREALAGKALFLFLVLGLPLGLAGAPRIFNDGDVSWHVAAGQWIVAHRSLPVTDPFSFTAAGRPWVPIEWLSEVIYATVYGLAGFAGLATVVAAALMALHAILFLHLRRYVGPLALAALFIGLDLVLGPFILARPHVLVWPLLAGWTVLLLRAAEAARAPPLWGALIVLVWTNLHGSFPLAIPIGAAIAFDALRAVKWATLRQWTVFALVSGLAMLLNANGAEGLLHPLRVMGMGTLPLIQEWQASSPSSTPLFYVVLLLGLGALLWRRVRVPIGRLVLLLVLLVMAFAQMRSQAWLVIVAAAAIPPLLGGKAVERGGFALLGLAAIPFLALRLALPITPIENAANPRHLIAAVPPELRSQPVLNGYTFGGPLILAGIRPYIDGRADMYGDAFFTDYNQITQGDIARFNRAVDRYDIRWTMLPPGNAALIKALDASPRWRRLYADRIGIIHVRK
ncbi:hypothetical protein [Sphingomonas sp.]|uniref:hypothetical protein n=1 Tax=Sphingomonas sp. TaxID=28214 RepID=UPI00286AE099|nr:hypothetical protein [Sphingomonas sp.]